MNAITPDINWIELKPGMLLRAKRDLRSSTRSWNSPQRSTIKENTILMAPSSGTRYGDVGPRYVGIIDAEGKFIPYPSLEEVHLPGRDDFLREGHKSRCPEDLGLADPDAYEIVGQLEGKLYEFYRSQAPHITHKLGIKPLVLVRKDGEFCFDRGYWEGWALRFDGGEQ